MISIKIGIPHEDLRPNTRPSSYNAKWKHAVAAKHKKNAYREGYYKVYNSGFRLIHREKMELLQKAERINGIMTLRPKNGTHMDEDNCLSACKYHIDGMCKALGINDKKISWQTIIGDYDKKSPHVELILEVKVIIS